MVWGSRCHKCIACFQENDQALVRAAEQGHVEVVKALLEAEPKVDIETKTNVGVLSPCTCIALGPLNLLSFSLLSF